MPKSYQAPNELIQRIGLGYTALILLCLAASIWLDQPLLWLLPAAVLGAALVALDFKLLYVAFFALLPFSVEIYLPNGLGTDLPTEPIMLALTVIAIVLGLFRLRDIDYAYLRHPITALLCLHLFWIFFSALCSQNPTVSFKFFLAKLWYVIPFYFLSLYFMGSLAFVRRVWSIFAFMLVISVSIVMVRYWPLGFDFAYIETIMKPFFRNHVNYASIMAVSVPWMWAWWADERGGRRWAMFGALVFILISVYFSYTRAAMLAVVMAAGVYWIVRLRMIRMAIAGAGIAAILGVGFLVRDVKWLDYAPDYNKTVSHRDFEDLISATYKMEDISTMERVYRWVAAGHMIAERPWAGFGPGTFTFYYKGYTVSDFQTYVSDNPENSGIHSYYLMTWVDQGYIGLLIFLMLVITILVYGEQVYHRVEDKSAKLYVMAALLSIFILDAILIINDMLEVDKTGPIYFVSAATIVALDKKYGKRSAQSST